MIVGCDFMMVTDSGVLPAQASMTLYQDDQLSWLSSPEHHVECQWIHPERNQLEVAALDTEPTGPANQEYGVRPEVASRVVADLGASDLALDAFSSGTSALLRVCALGPCDNQSCVKFNATTGQFNLIKMLNLSSYCAYIKKVQKNPKCAHFSPNFLFKIKIIDYALVLFGPSEAKPQAQESRYTKSKHHVVYRWRCRLNVQLNMVFLTLNALFPCVYEHKENAKQKCTY